MKETSLARKFICVSGASAGIGEACALAFAREGHRLFLGARRLEKLNALKEKCLTAGSPFVEIAYLDVEQGGSTKDFAQAALNAAHGKIDVLFNNAGLALGAAHVKDGNLDDWQRVINTNVLGVLRLTREILPKMIEQKSGDLVFLSSIAAHQVYEGGSVYCASKHAIKAIAQTLKLEVNGMGIRVCTVDPGLVETEFSVVRFSGDKQKAKSVYRGLNPLVGDDIARCVSFIVNSPRHVNIDELIVTPTAQASVYKVSREP